MGRQAPGRRADMLALAFQRNQAYCSGIVQQPSGAVSPKTPPPATPRAVRVGDRIRWLGRCWGVERIQYHPTFGRFFACTSEDDGSFELISEKGADGNYEVLEDAA